ncbi:MAG: hypothetical protein JWO98_5483, partial [Frankiales bacterium]|nr:hypothetical protein [Frankiales bacterium]
MAENENTGPASCLSGGTRVAPSVSTGVFDHLSRGALRPHLVRSVVFLAIVILATIWMIGLTLSALSALSQVGVHAPDLGPETDSFLSLLGLGGIVVFGLGWLISLFVAAREFVDEGGAVVVVREAGPHLYLGWTMWRERSTAALFGSVFADLVAGAGPDDSRLIEASSSGVLRELLRTATERSLPNLTDPGSAAEI